MVQNVVFNIYFTVDRCQQQLDKGQGKPTFSYSLSCQASFVLTEPVRMYSHAQGKMETKRSLNICVYAFFYKCRMESTEKCEAVIGHFNGKFIKTPPGVSGMLFV